MIKGRYVAQIEIDFQTEETNIGLEEIRNRMRNGWLSNAIEEKTKEIFDDMAEINITQQYADVWEANE